MIDLHGHLLPGVDDGAENLAQAVEMVRIAAADGCRALVATPHQRRDEWRSDDPLALADRLAELAATAGRTATGSVPQLLLGGEVRVDSDLLADLAKPGRGGVLSLAGSRYLLLEFEPSGYGPHPVELVLELRAEGWWPIIAHPEVVPFFWESDDDLLSHLVEAGAYFQVTAMSVTGEFGKGAKARVWELLRAGCVHFVASDSHRPEWRPPGLARARKAIARELGEALADDLTVNYPGLVVANREIPMGGAPELQLVPGTGR